MGFFRTPPARSELKVTRILTPFAKLNNIAFGRRAFNVIVNLSTQQDKGHDDAQGKDGNQGYPYEGFKFFAHGNSFHRTV
jgi:hypothetical protein